MSGWRETRDAAANFAAIVMDALTNMKFEAGNFSPCVQTRQQLFYHGDDFVILADENDLQWFAQELNEGRFVERGS